MRPSIRIVLSAALAAALAAAAAGACAVAEPADGSAGSVVFDDYGRQFHFEEPVPVDIWVDHRVIDHRARVADYLVRVGDRELEVVYALLPEEELPLRAEVFDARTLEPLAVARADDQILRIGDASGFLLEVSSYTSPTQAQVRRLADGELDPAAVTVLRASLPARVELGAVPAFFLNRDDVRPAGDGVVGATGTPRPVLPEWEASVSLLGAYVLGGSCVDDRAGIDYRCGFCRWDGGPAGLVEGGDCAVPAGAVRDPAR